MVEVHGGLLFWSVVTFILLLVVLKKIAWGPIISALENRELEIKNALNAAEKAKLEAEKISSDYEQSIKDAKIEAQKIISESKASAEKVKLNIEKSAEEKAESILSNAKEQISVEKENAINEIRDIAIDLSIDVASKVIGQNIDSNKNRNLAKEAMANIGNS